MAASVAVFAPTPRVSIHFETGERGSHLHFHAGGQGAWVGRMARSLGAEVTLAGAFGGESGVVVTALLEAEGIAVTGVSARDDNGTVAHRGNEGEPASTLFSTPDPVLGRHELDALHSRTLDTGLQAGVCVLTGTADEATVPPDVFRRLAADLSASGVTVVADLSGAQLRAAVAGGLSLIKASHEDLRIELDPERWHRSVQGAARTLAGEGVGDVLISCAELGAVAVVGGQGYRLEPPQLEAVNTRGAGDSMTGAYAAGLALGRDRVDALRVAVAAGALNVTRRGLATGDDRTIERLSERVVVRELGPLDRDWA
jgi:1-phosphofructokinase